MRDKAENDAHEGGLRQDLGCGIHATDEEGPQRRAAPLSGEASKPKLPVPSSKVHGNLAASWT
eukprot:CAMPEP_0174722696 /NCGR_PEP_ID=MMETSP1094-20130205/39063_1 /TAXON_ID=156173 /ORGANISM="Chrysochromulina brevifilum, Strain UTEX LB 985" /LENGTH=62 /DNA_ID=CAMNT_0015923599 /DNA_START=577 /DNA_END=765 /DNA_ORIENTATION=-